MLELALPTEESARIALRTQQIIAYKSGVTNTVDPVGGSEQIEGLTDALERGVLEYLKHIDEAGGSPIPFYSFWRQFGTVAWLQNRQK